MASRIARYSFLDACALYAISYYAPFWCDMCSSSDHNVISCPFYACYAQPDSFLRLAHYMGFEVGEPFGLVANFDINAAYYESKENYNVVYNLVETPLEGSCSVYVHEKSSSLGCKIFPPNSLDLPILLPCVHNLHFSLSIILMCSLIIR